MPYVTRQKRKELEDYKEKPSKAGEINYLITRQCLAFLPTQPSYDDYNEIVGVLESVKLEFYRRAVVPYEELKIIQNGDVY